MLFYDTSSVRVLVAYSHPLVWCDPVAMGHVPSTTLIREAL